MADRFDKFTERARRVMTQAQEEATRLGHNYIGTEHLLLGLVREGDGVAARVLALLGANTERVRGAVEMRIGRGDRMIVGEIGLTPRAKKTIELAVDEARRLGHHYIGTEHLLLGLVREGEGIAAEVLESLGVNLETVRLHTIQVLSHTSAERSVEPGQQVLSRGEGRTDDAELWTLLETFDGYAGRVLTVAQEEAMRLQHNYIGTEHIMLGLIGQPDGPAARVLADLGVRLDRLRSAVEFIIGRGDRLIVGEIGLTPQARRALLLAREEAQQLGQERVSPAHLLLGLLREREGIATSVLINMGVRLDTLRAHTLALLTGVPQPIPPPLTGMTQPAPSPGSGGRRPTWDYLVLHVTTVEGRRVAATVNGEEASVLGSEATHLYNALQALGREGWELIALDPLSEGDGDALYLFKRAGG